MGPTATGKTELALNLATFYPIEIISVDSALIYTDMNIGTAKPNPSQLQSVPHHLINIISPINSYSVMQFIHDSTSLIKAILKRGKLPLLVGGTMMYYNGLINGISHLPAANLAIRQQLESEALTLGLNSLYARLASLDSKAASKIKPTDQQRIIRALEVYFITGQPISKLQQTSKTNYAANIQFLPLAILPKQREILHKRIELRFKQMLINGFIDEVAYLQQKYPSLTNEHTSMRCVGYYQVWQYLTRQLNKEELARQGIAATRQLAKRQITWLRKMDIINIEDEQLTLTNLFNQIRFQVDSWLNQ